MSTATANTTTVEERFNRAVETVRSEGVVFAVNVMTCCRSCTDYADLGMTVPTEGGEVDNHAWAFGGQGECLLWDSGQPRFKEEDDETCTCTEDEYDEDEDGNEVLVYEGEECHLCRYGASPVRTTPAKRLYVYHGGKDALVAASAVRDAFVAEGFVVVWNGSTADAVQVNLL